MAQQPPQSQTPSNQGTPVNSNPYIDTSLLNSSLISTSVIPTRRQTMGSVSDNSHSALGLDASMDDNNHLQIHPPFGYSTNIDINIKKNQYFDPNEPITLNIGGIKYQTTFLTLSKYKNCVLYKMFEGKFSLKPCKDGSYFIDRNGKYFEFILDYLRTNKLNIPLLDNTNTTNNYLINHLLIEADYYQIKPLINQLKFLKIGTKLLKARHLHQIQNWICEEFPNRKNKPFAWKLLYQWNCDDITLKNPYNVMHAKCEGIRSILLVLHCGNRVFGAYTSVKWKAAAVGDSQSFVYWLDGKVVNNDIHDDDDDYKDNDDDQKQNNNNNVKKKKYGDKKYKFNYEQYREFKSYDSNSENHRGLKFCGGYNDVVVCRYRAAKHQYGHFAIYTNEWGYTVTASGPMALDSSMHLQRMEIFYL